MQNLRHLTSAFLAITSILSMVYFGSARHVSSEVYMNLGKQGLTIEIRRTIERE